MVKSNSIPEKQNKKNSGGCNTRKNISVPRKQNKNFSQNNKKFIKGYISSSGFPILK